LKYGVKNEEIAGAAVAACGFSLAGLNLLDGLLKLNKMESSSLLKIGLVYLFLSMRLVRVLWE
jgi:hypothetical protein